MGNQLTLERKYEQEAMGKFLEYSKDWWTEYKMIR